VKEVDIKISYEKGIYHENQHNNLEAKMNKGKVK